MHRTTIFLADSEREQLQAYCQKNERKQSEIIREALRQYLESKQK